MWLGATFASAGAGPFSHYIALGPTLLTLPRTEGFPGYALITPQGLASTLLPPGADFWVRTAFQALMVLLGLGLFRLAQRADAPRALAAALLYPLLTMPYALLHDALLLAPVLLLAAQGPRTERVRPAAVLIYLGCLVLPLLGYATGWALPALLTLTAAWALWPALEEAMGA